MVEGLGKSFFRTLTATPNTVLYEVPVGKKTDWTLLFVSNTTATPDDFSVAVFDASESTTTLLFNAVTLAVDEYLRLNANGSMLDGVHLKEGDQIQCWDSAGAAISVVLSVIERLETTTGG